MFKKLVKKYADAYLEFANEADVSENVKAKFKELLNEKDLSSRSKLWDSILDLEKNRNQLSKLANPFFIGFGKHDAEILFIGKEKGFDPVKYPELLLFESINNIVHWQKILNGETVDETDDFHPERPHILHKKNINGRHTWSKYKQVAYAIDPSIKDIAGLFNNCFCTELNYVPSPKSPGKHYLKRLPYFSNRVEFLKEFIEQSNFNKIIIGASTYFKKHNDDEIKLELENIFGELEEYQELHIVDRKILPFVHFKTKDGKRSILLTYQLSGGSSWSNEGLKGIGERMKMK